MPDRRRVCFSLWVHLSLLSPQTRLLIKEEGPRGGEEEMSPPTLNPSLRAQLQSCIGCFYRAKRNSHSSNRLQWL